MHIQSYLKTIHKEGRNLIIMEATGKVWRVRELRKLFILIVCTVYFGTHLNLVIFTVIASITSI